MRLFGHDIPNDQVAKWTVLVLIPGSLPVIALYFGGKWVYRKYQEKQRDEDKSE